MRRPARQPAGFSLIELLVVVTIVALLAAISLPVIRRTRLAARTTACLSNMRQIGVLVNSYLVHSNGVLPSLQNRESKGVPLPAMDNTLILEGEGAGIFRCPADDKAVFETSGSSYFWNFTVNGQKIESLFSIIGGSDAARVPLVSDKEGWHPEIRDRVVILYADGHAKRELTFFTELGLEVPPVAPEAVP